jgi:hypothetical protein
MFIVCGFLRYALREDNVENEQLCHCCCISKDAQTNMLGCETPTSARSIDCGTKLILNFFVFKNTVYKLNNSAVYKGTFCKLVDPLSITAIQYFEPY